MYTMVYASIFLKVMPKFSTYCGGLHTLQGVYPSALASFSVISIFDLLR